MDSIERGAGRVSDSSAVIVLVVLIVLSFPAFDALAG
jgi:hypothetical protein